MIIKNRLFKILDYKKIKFFFDILFSLIGLFILTPLIILISISIFLEMGRPIFYLQKRPGLNGKIFKIIKFRTMSNPINKNGEYLSEIKRISKIGSFLRRTSLDEIPELINILKGEMSFIGPRPLLVEYLPLYSVEQFKRHNVKPGLSGWAQINGRNTINWEKKFDLDLWYVRNISFILDLKIFFLTFLYILKQNKINHKDGLSMPLFKGKL